jgi:hypothetical protein
MHQSFRDGFEKKAINFSALKNATKPAQGAMPKVVTPKPGAGAAAPKVTQGHISALKSMQKGG